MHMSAFNYLYVLVHIVLIINIVKHSRSVRVLVL